MYTLWLSPYIEIAYCVLRNIWCIGDTLSVIYEQYTTAKKKQLVITDPHNKGMRVAIDLL